METRNYWVENGQSVKYDNYNSNDGFGRVGGDQLNFAAPSEDEADYPPGAFVKKGKQDPMSHRIIEKRRRDRMNNCLADLSRLIPPEYLKKGRGRIEKTEIIEMAIRHLKFLQDRASAAERPVGEDHFRAGFQEAVSEAVRFLVEVHGYGHGDGLCMQLTTHLQRHCEAVTKGNPPPLPENPANSNAGSSSETASSSGSSNGYGHNNQSVIQPPPAPAYQDYEPETQEAYPMNCDRVRGPTGAECVSEQPLDARRKRDPTLRAVRKPDHAEDYLHSYKFKNSIERRFSRSQDEAAEQVARDAHAHCKTYSHKRRRATKHTPSSTSASGSTEDNSPQDTSSESAHQHHYEKPLPPTHLVPVFALNSLGKYYVPLSVDYACLSRYLSPIDCLESRSSNHAAPLHPVTIHVNFQPYLNYQLKREPNDREWQPA